DGKLSLDFLSRDFLFKALMEKRLFGKRFRLPIEVGTFGKDHGEWSHVAQMLAGTTDMNRDELKLLGRGLESAASNQAFWDFWDLVFDAPRGVNSPRYWRDRIGQAPPPLRR